MKKVFVTVLSLAALGGLASCGQDSSKTIKVCASELPHAKILREAVAPILNKKGYTLKVSCPDGWTIQNPSTAAGDYDANYFQHVPYMEAYNAEASEANQLIFTCKVHYEPLSIYQATSATKDLTQDNVKYAICDDTSNAIRALQLLKDKGVFTTIPVSEDGTSLTFEGTTWTGNNGRSVILIKENLLATTLTDNSVAFSVLPCNTVLTNNVAANRFVDCEENPELETSKANGLAVRKNDYLNNATYKAKIDVLTDALVSAEVRTYINTTWGGGILCSNTTQIDMRNAVK